MADDDHESNLNAIGIIVFVSVVLLLVVLSCLIWAIVRFKRRKTTADTAHYTRQTTPPTSAQHLLELIQVRIVRVDDMQVQREDSQCHDSVAADDGTVGNTGR